MAYSVQPPNTPPTDLPIFATRVRWRTPEWKMHRGTGPTRNAITQHRSIEVWKLTPDGWRQVDPDGDLR